MCTTSEPTLGTPTKGAEGVVPPSTAVTHALLARHLSQLTYFLNMTAFGIFGVIYTFYIQQIILDADDDDGAVELSTFFMVLYAAMQTACNPVIGALTDAYGRRLPMILSVVIVSVGFIAISLFPSVEIFLAAASVMGLLDATTVMVRSVVVDFATLTTRSGEFDELVQSPQHTYLLSRVCYSVMGGHEADSPTTYEDAITREFALLSVYSAGGVFFGSVLGEVLYTKLGLRVAMFVAGFLLSPLALLLFLVMPETALDDETDSSAVLLAAAAAADEPALGDDEQPVSTGSSTSRRPECRPECEVGLLYQMWRTLRLLGHNRRVSLLLLSLFLGSIALSSSLSVLMFYCEDNYGLTTLGVMYMIVEAILVIPMCSLLIPRLLKPRVGYACSFATVLAVSAAGAILLASSRAQWLLFVSVGLFVVGFSALPLIPGPISDEVPHRDQGRLQGVVYATALAAHMVGSSSFLALYLEAAHYITLYVVALLCLVCIPIFVFSDREHDARDDANESVTQKRDTAPRANAGPSGANTPLLDEQTDDSETSELFDHARFEDAANWESPGYQDAAQDQKGKGVCT